MALPQEELSRLLARWQAAKSARSTLESTWEELALLFRPSSTGFRSERSPGDTRQEQIYDGEQIESADELARSIESMLMPRDEQWVQLTTEDQIEEDDDDASTWLDEAGKRLFRAMYEPAAGLERFTSQCYPDLVVFGAGVGFIGERRDLGGLSFRPLHLSKVYWLRDEAGNADTAFVTENLTARQVAQRYGAGAMSYEGRKLLADQPEREMEILQCVLPRTDYRPPRAGAKRPPKSTELEYASYTLEVRTKHLLSESGYNEFPFVIPEWLVLDHGDIWSPARRCMPDARMLQQMAKTVIKAGQKSVDPPIIMHGEGLLSPLKLVSGGVTYGDFGKLGPNGKFIERIDIGANMPIALELQQEQRTKVGNIFMRNVLSLPDRPNMTATEVLRRGNDLLRLTSSTFGRLETSLNQPLVERAFRIMLRNSVANKFGPGSPFPPPPESLRSQTINYKFLSPVARARRASETATFGQLLEVLIPLLQIRPDVLDNIEMDEIIRDIVSGSLAPKYVVAEDERDAKREQQAKAAQAQQQMAMLQMGADAIGKAVPALTPQAA